MTTLIMIAILFIPISLTPQEVSAHSASVKIRLTPPAPIDDVTIEGDRLREEQVKSEPQKEPHEQRSQTSDTEGYENSTDLLMPTFSQLAGLSDTVGEQMPLIERPQRQASPQQVVPSPDQSSHTGKEQEWTVMHYHSLDEVTTAPGFDRALLASRIVYPDLAKRQGKEGLVMLRLFISSYGQVERVIVEQDPGYGFAEAAVRAFRGLTGKPAMKQGEAVAVTLLYPVRFTLS